MKVFLVSESPALRRHAEGLLADAGLTPAANCAVLSDLAESDQPEAGDLVLYLSTLDVGTRIGGIEALLVDHPGIRLVAAIPRDASGSQLRRIVQGGIAGVVNDEGLDTTLVATVLAVQADQLAVPSALRRHVAPKALSHREKQVVSLAVLGLTNRQIAAKLFLAESTVKTHLSSAFVKLDARNRAEAARMVLGADGVDLGLGTLLDQARLAA